MGLTMQLNNGGMTMDTARMIAIEIVYRFPPTNELLVRLENQQLYQIFDEQLKVEMLELAKRIDSAIE
jgi:hypothetical protein